LKKRSPTDVITFVDKRMVDIVISLDQAFKQAKPRGLKLFEEVALLMCHGLLHAKGLGDLRQKDKLWMRKSEFEQMMRAL